MDPPDLKKQCFRVESVAFFAKSSPNRSRKPPGTSRSSLWPSWGSFGPSWGSFGASWGSLWSSFGPPGTLLGFSLGALGSLWGASWPSKSSRRLSRRPPARELNSRSILGAILAPFWHPPDLKKHGFRVEGVAFFKNRLLRFFELPGAKKTSKKPFRLVNYEVLVGENVKSFGLAAFLDDQPRPNRDFWRSQSAFPRFLRVEMGPKSRQ